MNRTITFAPLLAAMLASGMASGQTLLKIDASAPVKAPLENQLRMGAAVSPSGERLGVNSQYLTRNGKPWMPVMGEFHYSRTPPDEWETELRKMKAAGIDILATYVMWNHHEEREGKFDWSGQRDLRRFVQLAAKAGLEVVVRMGPWVHAEVRYGGIPDWVVNAMPTRKDDPQYLRHVERLYTETGRQLKGLLWKDGGPVIGAQIENEYNLDGPGEGAGHISTLKGLARKAGVDVPMYTVTGWDQTVYPSGEVTPVFGGYPDEPWARGTTELPPKETYAFRFDSRVSGDLGAQTVGKGKGTADSDIEKTPFLGAEYGAGLPFMYRRRPVVSPDDIASMLPVQLGSGVNLVGYYMFHGGRNPMDLTSLEESTLSGGYNDTPMISYDFQAPLGPDGQQRPVLAKLRPYHLFMRDFGDRLAPMTVRKPDVVPTGPEDLATPRYSVRAKGDSAFLFFSNHVRQYPMPAQRQLRFSVKLPGGDKVFPRQPVDVADGGYFVWPVNFDLDGTRLSYATAQPVARLDTREGIVYVFAASDGIPVELGFESGAEAYLLAPGARVSKADAAGGDVVVDGIQPGTGAAVTLRRAAGRPVTVMVLTAEQARQLTVGQLAGQRRLVLSAQQTWFADGGLRLRSNGDPAFRFAVYPPLAKAPKSAGALRAGSDGLFQAFDTALPERRLRATITPVRAAQPVAPVMTGGLAKAAIQPVPESFRNAAAWRIDIPREAGGKQDALIDLDFVGDIGRLFNGTRMLDDWYYSGYGWQYPLKHAGAGALTLSVLPLRADAPVYIPKEGRPDFGGKPQVAELRGVRVTPVYHLSVRP
ncbi:beta-galactosidase [Pseudoduganella namucuonensis]|uniref:Beta-galactosidase n=1 Tax=Pseudoduganella namucuonensis TaxID=1035707 RepID=A0A1I7G989_9BURK|nr:beta-galactosidase [Pseudoduganella namucuonensis]SFU44911.1 Glycosyl hydrolases family 35 [Pseudoduganella namucuonensis]